MEKSALFTAAVSMAFSLTFSLSLMACGDETSATSATIGELSSSGFAPVNSSSSDSEHFVRRGFSTGVCKANVYDGVLAKETSASERLKAFFVEDSTGAYHIFLPDVKDHCSYYGEQIASKERSGDTLFIKINREKTYPSACMCYMDYWFDVDEADIGVKYVQFGDIYDVESGPFPASSSSIESSSSESLLRQQASNIVAECQSASNNIPSKKASSLVVNVMDTDDSANRTAPVARKYVGVNGVTSIIVDKLNFPCGVLFKKIEVISSSDTLYVKPEVDPDSPIVNCICPTRISFDIKNETEFSQAHYVKIDGFDVFQLVNGTYEKSVLLKKGFAKGQCNNDVVPSLENINGATNVSPSNQLPIATLYYSDSDGTNVIDVNNAVDYCDVDAKISQKFRKDTLFVKYADVGASSDCICTFNVIRFAISQENLDAKYFSFNGVVYQIAMLMID